MDAKTCRSPCIGRKSEGSSAAARIARNCFDASFFSRPPRREDIRGVLPVGAMFQEFTCSSGSGIVWSVRLLVLEWR